MAKDNTINETVVETPKKVFSSLKKLKPYAIGAGAVIGILLARKGVELLFKNEASFEEVVDSALKIANES